MTDKKQVNRQIFHILFPMILENLLTISASLVTTAMVGRLLTLDISAQGVANRITNTYFSLFKGLSMGVTVTAALYFGQRRADKARRTVEQSFTTAIPLALLFSFLIAVFSAPLARIFTSDAAMLTAAGSYMRLMAIGLPFVSVSCFVTAAFQSQGNTRVPMYIAGVVNIVNIALGWVLIFGHLGAPALGLTGAGIALVSAQITGALLGVYLLYQPNFGLFSSTASTAPFFAMERPLLKEIYTVGMPAAGENLLWQFATILISRIILSYGSAHYAAYQLGLQAEGVTDILSVGFITAATTLAANAIGSKNDALYRAYYKQLTKICLGVSVLCTVILLFGNTFLMSLLTDKSDLIAIGAKYIFVMGFTQIPINLSKILNGFIRAAGHKYTPMVISFIGIWLVRVVCSFVFARLLHWPIEAIWWAIALDLFVRYFISFGVLKRKRVLDHLRDSSETAALQEGAV